MIFVDCYDNISFLETLLGITNNVVIVTTESTFNVSSEDTTERQTMTQDHMANDSDSSGNIFFILSIRCDQYMLPNEHTACMIYFLLIRKRSVKNS